jgi:hypothetical protein
VQVVSIVNEAAKKKKSKDKKKRKDRRDSDGSDGDGLSGISLVWSDPDRRKEKPRSLLLALVVDLRRGHRTPVFRQQVLVGTYLVVVARLLFCMCL